MCGARTHARYAIFKAREFSHIFAQLFFIDTPDVIYHIMARVKKSAKAPKLHDKKHPYKEDQGSTRAAKQMEEVTADPWALEKIDSPSEELQLAAVGKNGCVIRCIKSPSEAVQLAAVSNYGHAIDELLPSRFDTSRRPSLQVIIAAVKRDPWVMERVWDSYRTYNYPDEESIVEVLRHCGAGIQRIPNPTDAMYEAAAENDPLYMLGYCRGRFNGGILPQVAPAVIRYVQRNTIGQ